ncbi:predicted GPI-anchored protein 58 [Ostrinia furnacalis]|uniref:predicted GPI-anchored protein 58 n=1 Tax=Ostrinia furnacalis TaxID=93504 RepID=UPI0010404840|nr:predicted GPI-anchored protein 58 [Ostrinia furnacalis]
MKILPLIMLLACVAWQVSARAQDEVEPRASPSRGLLKRGLAKKPSTTTTPAPQEEEYEDEGDYPAEGEQEPSTEAPPSSTEGKKLVGGGVRPFRSNTDLLETLKRRRAQAAEAKHSSHAPIAAASQSEDAPTEAPPKGNFSKKRFNNAPPAREATYDDAPAPSKPSRGRFGRPAARSIPEPENEEQNDAAPPTRTGRGFSRRGGY